MNRNWPATILTQRLLTYRYRTTLARARGYLVGFDPAAAAAIAGAAAVAGADARGQLAGGARLPGQLRADASRGDHHRGA